MSLWIITLLLCSWATSIETTVMYDDKPKESGTKQDLVFKRTFDVPVEKVWKAWSESEQVMKWWGPTGFTCPSAKMDFRVGGTSLVCMRAPKEFGGQDMYSSWKYQVLEKHQRIEYIHNLCDPSGKPIDPKSLGFPVDFPQNQKHVATFKDLGNGKTELTITEHGWSPGQMMEMSKMGMNQCLDKMAASFSK